MCVPTVVMVIVKHGGRVLLSGKGGRWTLPQKEAKNGEEPSLVAAELLREIVGDGHKTCMRATFVRSIQLSGKGVSARCFECELTERRGDVLPENGGAARLWFSYLRLPRFSDFYVEDMVRLALRNDSSRQ